MLVPVGMAAKLPELAAKLKSEPDDVNGQRIENERDQQRNAEIYRAVRTLRGTIPAPLTHATLDNYQLSGDSRVASRQQEILDRLSAVRRMMPTFCKDRGQLFFWGSVGTGKDHLAVAMAKHAAMQGATVRLIDGEQWFSRYLTSDRRASAFELALSPQIIVLSDPVSSVQWTEGRQQALRTLVNTRWSRGRATWITANVPSLDKIGEDCAIDLFGADTFSRLSHRTEFFEMRWADFRRTDGLETKA